MSARVFYSLLYSLPLIYAGLVAAQGYTYGYDSGGNDPADSPFAAFKANVIETGCTVPRIDPNPPWGVSKLDPGDGAVLEEDEIRGIYDCILPAMRSSLANASSAHARQYLSWERFSKMPYRSRRHSHRYVSNYANAVAAPHYIRYEQAGTMPVGSVLAKDSFAVAPSGRAVLGALSLMEKMPAGFNPEVGDWRFSLVLPDGRLFGSTGGVNGYAVKFCQECHIKAGAEQDYMYLLPETYRVSE
ncbi:MAG: hypothetical protein R3202_10475 [Candidatus Competibacterales bacterium]|nr:hypothetical protein [Candidatus Competibacterales bacterium]